MDSDNTHENSHDDHQHDDTEDGIRPLGYWLRVVEGLLHREFATAFGAEGVSRREWMLLSAVAGDVKAPGFAAGGKGMRRLERRGWVEETGDGTWVLTDEGRAAKERLGAVVDGIRAKVAGAVSPEEFATTLASLEAIARELGWDENERMPRPGRGFGRGSGRPGPWPAGGDIHHGFGPNLHHGFRPGFGPGGGPTSMPDDAAWCPPHAGHGHGHGDHRHGYGHGHSHGNGHGGEAERSYERGFDAGFRRGQEAS